MFAGFSLKTLDLSYNKILILESQIFMVRIENYEVSIARICKRRGILFEILWLLFSKKYSQPNVIDRVQNNQSSSPFTKHWSIDKIERLRKPHCLYVFSVNLNVSGSNVIVILSMQRIYIYNLISYVRRHVSHTYIYARLTRPKVY